jgi:hypothetical protein
MTIERHLRSAIPTERGDERLMKVAILTGQRAISHYAGIASQEAYDRVGRNTGNMAFTTAIVDHIDDDVTFHGWSEKPSVLSAADLVVMPCANHFGAHTDMGALADLLLEAGTPVLAIGLGAQAGLDVANAAPTEGTLRWAQALQKLRIGDAPNILVRGEFTRAQLARFDIVSTEVIGCPSNFLSSRADLGRFISRKITQGEPARIATVAGHSSSASLAVVDQLMVALATGSIQGLPWILQEEVPLIDLARGREVHPALVEKLAAHFVPGLPGDVFAEWVRTNAVVFFEVEAWMEHMQRFDACVGPRFHGAMLAAQAGTPSVVVTHDRRTAELCDTTGLASVSASEVMESGARPIFTALQSFDGDAFDARRGQLAVTYRQLLEGNGLRVTNRLRAIEG